jgi:hypothetical protein
MPVTVDGGFRRVDTQRKIDALDCMGTTLLVWWYCGIFKNTRDQSQPLVLVAFRTQIRSRAFTDQVVYRYISIALLGQLPIGSLCRDNRVIGYATFQTKEFEVLYEKGGGWRFTSFDEAASEKRPRPFPLQIHPLAYPKDKNWLIEFRLDGGGTLLIPCLTYFCRCYGQSGELRRVLTTYKWDVPDGCLDRLFAPLDEPEDPHGLIWKVKLRKRMADGDAVFLAHVKYDPYTQLTAKSIHSEIDIQYGGNSKVPAFAKIGPWYEGPATLRVGGIPFNDDQSFLGLQILGSTEPAGEDIARARENRGNAVNPAGPGAEGNAWADAPVRGPRHRPEIVNLSTFDEPDNGGDVLDVDDPDFVIFGPRRIVRTHRNERAKDSAGPRGEGNGAGTYSAGESHGDGKGIGQAAVKTQIVLESEGALRDIWNAMQHMKMLYRGLVTSVEWYTPTRGFSSSEEPELAALEPFTSAETIEGRLITATVKTWPYLDPVNQTDLRGLLVARMTLAGKNVHIIEIQRRPCKRKNANGVKVDSEEPFRGLVFTLDHPGDFDDWFRFVQSNIRHVKGVVHKLTRHCPGKADSFRHVPSSTDEVACWAALKNALKKVDLHLN